MVEQIENLGVALKYQVLVEAPYMSGVGEGRGFRKEPAGAVPLRVKKVGEELELALSEARGGQEARGSPSVPLPFLSHGMLMPPPQLSLYLYQSHYHCLNWPLLF